MACVRRACGARVVSAADRVSVSSMRGGAPGNGTLRTSGGGAGRVCIKPSGVRVNGAGAEVDDDVHVEEEVQNIVDLRVRLLGRLAHPARARRRQRRARAELGAQLSAVLDAAMTSLEGIAPGDDASAPGAERAALAQRSRRARALQEQISRIQRDLESLSAPAAGQPSAEGSRALH